MLSVLTAFLHFLALVPIVMHDRFNSRLNRIYAGTILMSASVSVLWHYYGEPVNVILLLNYLLAIQWFLLDFAWSKYLGRPEIIEYNSYVAILFVSCLFCEKHLTYHSLWHIISAAKCFGVSCIIYKYDSKNMFRYKLP